MTKDQTLINSKKPRQGAFQEKWISQAVMVMEDEDAIRACR
ncbi:hypothetical protein RP726_08035 [Candidatus Methylospira mobilis]|nr:hypothetical protein [Candidatus Methylospira mobilis]WNV06344.1 hypothetical protein RP726_08035 [Candidatus Methylospira mobilis]